MAGGGRVKREQSDWTAALAGVLYDLRVLGRLRQRDVAEAAGMPTETYRRIETGERVPDVSQLHRIASVYGLRVSQVVGRAEQVVNGHGAD